MWSVRCSHVAQLAGQGFSVVDNVLPNGVACDLRDEIVAAAMSRSELLSPNATISVSNSNHQRKLVAKRNIAEFDLTNAAVSSALPSLASLNSAWNLHSHSVKAQINFGAGACFPCHYDSHPTLDLRRVTAILNEQYKHSDGGQLRLYPFPNDPVDVDPVFNRLVLFSSSWCLHRVLPSITDRLCFTIWFSNAADTFREKQQQQPKQDEALQNPASPEIEKPVDPIRHSLLEKENRALLCNLVYAKEWADSIVQSHPDTPDRALLLETHWKNCAVIERRLAEKLPKQWQTFAESDWRRFLGESESLEWF